jgi:hypothetical protein
MPKKKNTAETPARTRVRRPLEERLAEVDAKIEFHERAIATLKAKKEKMQAPRKSRATYGTVLKLIKASGKSPEEIMRLLQEQNQ